ncbi:MAG: hypothetical protein ACR2JH_05110 [Solirubrobacteraceae bacterium]
MSASQGEIIRRQPDGRVFVVAESPDRVEAEASEPPAGTVPGHDYNSPSTGG